jgi:hypothetical protein
MSELRVGELGDHADKSSKAVRGSSRSGSEILVGTA